ncbi:MAG: WYL domain-containing protein [Acidimicrobiales bacterium]
MKKLERLMNLTAALLSTSRPLTIHQIHERVEGYPQNYESFRRAFERDKDDLRDMGVPIVIVEVPGEDRGTQGYRIPPEDYYLTDPGLEPDELAALRLASRVVRMEGFGADQALWKLGGVGSPAADRTPALAALPADRNLPGLFAAIANRNVVCFDYRGEQRTVEPRRLDFGRGRWYLTAHDRERDDTRNFRLDRIVGAVQVLDELFPVRSTPAAGARLEPWEMGGSEVVQARLLVDRPLAAWAERRLGADRVTERRDDGAVVVTIPVTNEDAFRSFVVEFLEHAEILEPAELRASYVAWLTGIAS